MNKLQSLGLCIGILWSLVSANKMAKTKATEQALVQVLKRLRYFVCKIKHFMSEKARFKPFEPKIDCTMPYPVQTVQPLYRVTESFEKSLKDL